MDITPFLEMTFARLEAIMQERSSEYPKPTPPAKPKPLGSMATATEHRAYADALDELEQQVAAYHQAMAVHKAVTDLAHQAWVEKLKAENAPQEPDAVFKLAYDYAYSQHISSGFHAVREAMPELMELVTAARGITLVHTA